MWLAASCLAVALVRGRALRRCTPVRDAFVGIGSGRLPGQVKPLLTRHCVSCHGAVKPRGGLRLDTAAAASKGEERACGRPRPRRSEPAYHRRAGRRGDRTHAPESAPAFRERISLLPALDRPGGQGDRRRAAGIGPESAHWAFSHPEALSSPMSRSSLGAKHDRPFHSGPSRAGRRASFRGSRPGDLAPPG